MFKRKTKIKKANRAGPIKNWDSYSEGKRKELLFKTFDEIDAHNESIHHNEKQKQYHIRDCITKDACRIFKKSRSFVIQKKEGFFSLFLKKIKRNKDIKKGIWRPRQRYQNGRWEYVDW